MKMNATTHLTKLSLSGLALIGAALSAPRSASADQTFDISVGGETRWMTSSSMRAVSSDSNVGMPSVTAGYHLGPLLPLVDVAVDVGLDGGGQTGTMFERVTTETSLLNVTASARAIRPIAGPVGGFARAGVGMRRLSLTLGQDGHRVRDGGWAPLASLGAGLQATPLRADSGVALGVRIEGGYAFDAGEPMRAEPSRSDDGRILLPATSARLGRLNASGFTLRMGLVLSY